jgi:hypothetical protein
MDDHYFGYVTKFLKEHGSKWLPCMMHFEEVAFRGPMTNLCPHTQPNMQLLCAHGSNKLH